MLLQNLFLQCQAPLWEPGTEVVQEWGEEGAELLAVVLHRWTFQALRNPPQIFPPFPTPSSLLQARGVPEVGGGEGASCVREGNCVRPK